MSDAGGVTCGRCGTVPESDAALALSWMRDTDTRGRAGWVCPDCTRENVRSIEAKLDAEWW